MRKSYTSQTGRVLVVWTYLFVAVICCVLYSLPVFSEPVPVWAVLTQENSDLPSNGVSALAYGADGALWVGTVKGGLARLDKDGHWQTYSKASTQGRLPDDNVSALAGGADGALWVGTDGGGLSNFRRPSGQLIRIDEVIGGKANELNKVTEREQTIAVTAFDDSYLTLPGMFHYIWRLSEGGLLGPTPGPEITTKSTVYTAKFPNDGQYQLRVVAVDRYGNRSDPKRYQLQCGPA